MTLPLTGVADASLALDRRSFPSSRLLYMLVAGVIVACVMNGMSIRIWGNLQSNGLIDAIGLTFGISAIVWFSLYNAGALLRAGDLGAPRRLDGLVVGLAVVAFLTPLSSVSWIALTLMSVNFYFKPGVNAEARRAFLVLLALSFSMQWTRWIAAVFLPTILDVDALLVSLLSGYQRHGNLVTASDGKTTLEILEACSSFTNASLTFLGWINARAYFGTRGLKRGTLFLSLMIALVVLINTARIALIALWPDQYELIHGPIGAFVANTLSTLVIIALAIVGAGK